MHRVPLFLALLLSPSFALAHPGHGVSDSSSALHWLTDHPLLAVGLVAAIAIGWWRVARRERNDA